MITANINDYGTTLPYTDHDMISILRDDLTSDMLQNAFVGWFCVYLEREL